LNKNQLLFLPYTSLSFTSLAPRCAVLSRRRFKFHKRSEFLIRTHNEMLSVVSMCVRNPELALCSQPLGGSNATMYREDFCLAAVTLVEMSPAGHGKSPERRA
jgi:hypothetical protein